MSFVGLSGFSFLKNKKEEKPPLKRAEIIMAGRSFGVDYLLWIKNEALDLDLRGETFFKDDGSIKIIAEGEEENLLKFSHKLQNGSIMHEVENYYVKWMDAYDNFLDFYILGQKTEE